MIKNTGSCGCSKTDGRCPVHLGFECITYDGCELEGIGASSGDNGVEILKLIDKAISSNKLSAANVGGGAEIYKGISDKLVYEFKTLLGRDGVVVEEGEKTITLKVDEAFLNKWLDSNFEITPEVLKSTFNIDEFKTYFSAYLQDIMNRPEVRKFFEDHLWTIFGSQSFQEKFLDFLKVIYNEEKWKTFYEDYLKMMLNKIGFKEFYINYFQNIFNTPDFKDFLEGYLLMLFNREPIKEYVGTIVNETINNFCIDSSLDEGKVKEIVKTFVNEEAYYNLIRSRVEDTFYENLRNNSSKAYIKTLFNEFLKGVNFCERIKNCDKGVVTTPVVEPDATLGDVVYDLSNRAFVNLTAGKFEMSYTDPNGDEPFVGRSIRFANNLEGRLMYDGQPVLVGQEVASFNLDKLSYRAKDQNALYSDRVEITLI